jgi:PhoD-like phosphatase
MRVWGRRETEPTHAGIWTRRRFLAAGSAAAVGLPVLLGAERASGLPSVATPQLATATLDGDGLLAAVRTSAPAEVRLRAWPVADPDAVRKSPWVPTNAARVAKLSLPDAGAAGEAWEWRAVVRDPKVPLEPSVNDVIRTIPARPPRGRRSAFTFAFGCCTTGIPGISFSNLRRADPQFFAMIGDFGYPDKPSAFNPIAQTYDGYLEVFARILAHPRMDAITSSAPFFAVQDDHDYGADSCDRTTVRSFAGEAFADLMPGGCWPGPNYRSWSVGEVDFFLTDNRRWKDPDPGPYGNGRYMSVLGTRQREWLLEGLAASDAVLKVVFIPMTMAWYWSRAEANELNTFITEHVSGTVVFCSGDKHAGAVARYSHRIWEFLAAPLSNPTKHTTGPRTPAVIWTENGIGPALYNAYGLVDVDTVGAGTCTLRLMREDGVEMHRQTIPLAR